MSIEEVYNQTQEKVNYRPPFPMHPATIRRFPDKHCRYHRTSGHNTTECLDLKDEIEALIRGGELGQYRADRREGNRGAPENNHP